MKQQYERLPYESTNAFGKTVLDYLHGDKNLASFYAFAPNINGIQQAIAARRQFNQPRELLVTVLREQYAGYDASNKQIENITALLSENTFTITTAHQPNIFTGPLYFIYKILHAIKLAEYLNEQLPASRFVPVYYMGSEDADLDELGHFYLDDEKIEWSTDQQGAVGRMHTKGFDKMIDRLEGQFAHLPHGVEMLELCRNAYLKHKNIQEATFYLVNELFSRYGLLVLIPDNALLKKAFKPIVQRELSGNFSQPLVNETIRQLSAQDYKIQVTGRDINLFYLDADGRRERIEKDGNSWVVRALNLSFTENEIKQLSEIHPEVFSANVILRGLFQSTVLPDVAFVGGGGELAYWLELKSVFEAAGVPYPVLLLRNSFLLLSEKDKQAIKKLSLKPHDLFKSELRLLDEQVVKNKLAVLDMQAEEKQLFEFYGSLQQKAAAVDSTLHAHVAALHTQALKNIRNLDKKIRNAARKKLEDEGRAITRLKNRLFPKGGLQERIANFMPYYALYGDNMIDMLYDSSATLEGQFTVLELPS